MPSTRKGGGEAPPGNTKKPNKAKRQLVRWDRKFNLNFVLLSQALPYITELLQQITCRRFSPALPLSQE